MGKEGLIKADLQEICYCPSPMALNLSFWLNCFGLYILLPSIRIGCLIFWMKSSSVSFFEFLPFGYDDAAIGVFQAFDEGRGVSDFVFEDGFGVGNGNRVVGGDICAFV